MAKQTVALRLLHSEVRVRSGLMSRLKNVMEEVDMALYDRSSAIGFVYSNFGDLLKKVHGVGAVSRPSLVQFGLEQKDTEVRRDSLVELRDNVARLTEMQSRLNFMLSELEGVIRKS